MRAGRVTLDQVRFDLLPSTFPHGSLQSNRRRDLATLYQTIYRQVFGSEAVGNLHEISDSVTTFARLAGLSIAQYMLINMAGFQLSWPDKTFTAKCLVDNRAPYRTKIYAEACREKFGSIDVDSIDNLTGQDNAFYDLQRRMLDAEKQAGAWIINWKMQNDGPPYEALFDALETKLDPNWLAIEPRFQPRMLRLIQHVCDTQEHRTIGETFHRLKKRSYEARGNFLARQAIMPGAVESVLSDYGFTPSDFERQDSPVTDPLQFWHRLALAIQHFSCLKIITSSALNY